MKTKVIAMIVCLMLLLAGCLATQPTVLYAVRQGVSEWVALLSQRMGTQPTVLHAVRPSLVGYRQQVVPPFDRTVRDAAAVQRLYAAALALPISSNYGAPCPPDFHLVYHLTFLAGTSQLQQIDVEPLGCSFVFLSQTDVRQADQSFLTLLAHTIGLPRLDPAGLLPGGE